MNNDDSLDKRLLKLKIKEKVFAEICWRASGDKTKGVVGSNTFKKTKYQSKQAQKFYEKNGMIEIVSAIIKPGETRFICSEKDLLDKNLTRLTLDVITKDYSCFSKSFLFALEYFTRTIKEKEVTKIKEGIKKTCLIRILKSFIYRNRLTPLSIYAKYLQETVNEDLSSFSSASTLKIMMFNHPINEEQHHYGISNPEGRKPDSKVSILLLTKIFGVEVKYKDKEMSLKEAEKLLSGVDKELNIEDVNLASLMIGKDGEVIHPFLSKEEPEINTLTKE